MLSKITKRDLAFDKKIKKLPIDWLDYNHLAVLDNKHLGMAEHWKFIVHHAQRDAAKSLFYAYSNQHTIGHKIIRRNNRIVLSSQVVEKAYYLRYCVVLLQACGDKLAQVIRCFMDIKTWITEDGGKKEAEERTTTLRRLETHLRLSEKKDEAFLSEVDAYLNNENVKRILQLANQIKHKWITSYQGEGLYPLRNPFIYANNKARKSCKVEIIGMSCGENIDSHIRDAYVTNNLFVDLSLKVDNLFKERTRREYEENSFSC